MVSRSEGANHTDLIISFLIRRAAPTRRVGLSARALDTNHAQLARSSAREASHTWSYKASNVISSAPSLERGSGESSRRTDGQTGRQLGGSESTGFALRVLPRDHFNLCDLLGEAEN